MRALTAEFCWRKGIQRWFESKTERDPRENLFSVSLAIEKLCSCHFQTERYLFPLGSSSKGWEQKKLNQQRGKIFGIRDFGCEEEHES